MMTSIFLFYTYLFLALVIGCTSSRHIASAKDFYIAGKRMGVWQTTGTLLATILGSSAILGSVDMAYASGWAGAWLMLCGALGLAVLAPLCGVFQQFSGFHLPALLGNFYGPLVNRSSAAVIAVAWLGVVSAQFIGAAEITTAIFGVSYPRALMLIGCTIAVYTALGGQFSIIRTDILQALFIIVGILIVFFGLLRHTPVPAKGLPMFSRVFSFGDLLILILTYASTFVAGPDIYSRLLCAKDAATAKKALYLAAAILVPIAFILAYFGICGAQSITHKDGAILFSLVRQNFSLPIVLVIYFATLSAIMSSADTTLFTAGTLLSQFICNEQNTRSSIFLTRLSILAIAAVSLLIAFFCRSILSVFFSALTVYSGAFIVPVILGMAGFRSRPSFALWAIAVGGMLALAGRLLPMPWDKIIIVAAFVLNFLILFVGRKK